MKEKAESGGSLSLRPSRSTDQVQGQTNLGNEAKQKTGEDVINKGVMFQPLQAVEFSSFGQVVLDLELRREERSCGTKLLRPGVDRLLLEAVKLNPVLPRRTQDARGARISN